MSAACYRVDPADASLYHMVIDSTAIPLDTVIEVILAAVRAQIATPPAHRDPAPTQPSAS